MTTHTAPKGINIEALTPADHGRGVIYRAAPQYEPEHGRITSYNSKYIFAEFAKKSGGWSHPQACDPSDLDWEFPVSS